MKSKRIGKQTMTLSDPPSVLSFAAVGGRMEACGPLKDYFDELSEDHFWGEKTWEKGESTMQKHALSRALEKANLQPRELDAVFAGDLLNHCIGSAFSLREFGIPFYGLYGACSTMGESLSLAAMAIDGGFAETVMAATSSHFCSSERQFRFPLEYGGQRTPSAQWTVTGAGSVILKSCGEGAKISAVTTGVITDAGITDANNMGAAMAPAAYATLSAHFADTGRTPAYYDLIVTGDLGAFGHDNLEELFRRDGTSLGEHYTDCGLLIYDRTAQDVHAGGSGCGCSASVFCSYILGGIADGRWKKVLFAPTGALMSPTSTQQGVSISGICHAVAVEA